MESLLRLRKAARDERREELAQAEFAAEKLRGESQSLQQRADEIRQQMRSGVAPGNIDVDQLVAAERFAMTLQVQHRAVNEQIELVAQELQRRRDLLLQADRDVRVLEKLREKHRAQHEQQIAQEELKELDEIAARAAARNLRA